MMKGEPKVEGIVPGFWNKYEQILIPGLYIVLEDPNIPMINFEW